MQRFYFKSSPSTGFYWDATLLHHSKSQFQDIKVIDNPEMGKTLVLDDYIMVSQKDEHQYHELIVHPNCVQLPSFNHALIIGGGDGLCAEEMLKYPFKSVNLVEIDEAVSTVSREFFQQELGGVFENTRFHTYYQDALKFFPNEQHYDFIALDLNDPAEDFMHSHPLYSGEFYETCKSHLAGSGIMCVQVGCPYLFTPHFLRNVNMLKNLFRHVAIYGQYMRCYGTYQYFASCSDTIDVTQPALDSWDLTLPVGYEKLKLYNIHMHPAMLVQNNEIRQILKG